jgi:hypothetical protein
MYHAEKNGARLVVLYADVPLAEFYQWNVTSDIALDQHTGSLVYNKEMIVLIYDVKRRCHLIQRCSNDMV